jgi:hypothetical protein
VTSPNDRARPWFPVSVQYMVRVYCVLITSYMRFMTGEKWRFVDFGARGRFEPEVTSLFDSSTTVSY